MKRVGSTREERAQGGKAKDALRKALGGEFRISQTGTEPPIEKEDSIIKHKKTP